MKTPIKARQTMLGQQLTIVAGKDRFPVTILFNGFTPMLVFGNSLTPIANPYRFGPFETPRERHAFVRAFVGDWDTHRAAWDAIPCSDCGKIGDPCACEA